ncbi:hypothetical protein SVIOM74S_06101 [Streptomyces violarus]
MLPRSVVAVGVQRGGEPALGGAQFAHHEVGGLQGDPAGELGAGGTPEVGVDPAQQGVVVQHLLEVRHDPVTVDRVAGEAAAELVVDAAPGHALAGVLRHLEGALGTGAGVVAQQELQHHGRRELRRPAESAALRVVLAGQREQRLRELLLAGRPVVPVGDLPPGQVPDDLPGDLGDLVPPVLPRLVDALEHLPEGGHALARGGREVRAEVERLGVRREEDGHGPAAVAGRGLHGLHVDRVDVRALLAVHLHAHVVRVEVLGGLLILEGLVSHHVTPVTAAVADAEQHGHVPLAGLLEGLRRPGPPVDGVVGVLKEVGGRLVRQSVRHGVHPAAVPRPARVRRRAGDARSARPTDARRLNPPVSSHNRAGHAPSPRCAVGSTLDQGNDRGNDRGDKRARRCRRRGT